MTGIGNDYQIASLSNCFVIGLDGQADSYGAIIRIDEEQVQLMKRRGGVGHDLSHIRPKGSPVKNSARYAADSRNFLKIRTTAAFFPDPGYRVRGIKTAPPASKNAVPPSRLPPA